MKNQMILKILKCNRENFDYDYVIISIEDNSLYTNRIFIYEKDDDFEFIK